MLKSELLRAIQHELMQYDFDCFREPNPSCKQTIGVISGSAVAQRSQIGRLFF